MAIIKCPNTSFCDIRVGVKFIDGVGETEDERAIEWFKSNGYTVEEEAPKKRGRKPKDEGQKEEKSEDEEKTVED